MAAMQQTRGRGIQEDLTNVEFETSEDVEVLPTFNTMGLREELLRGIYAYGKFFLYEKLKIKNVVLMAASLIFLTHRSNFFFFNLKTLLIFFCCLQSFFF